MTNKGARAILGLPQMPERQLRFLLALETFTRREDGWRPSGTELLADAAGLSPRTVAKARSELVAAGLIDYRRGDGRGHVSTYQIRAPGVADHHLKVATEVATFKGGNDVATFTQAERWQPEPVKVADQADKGSRRNALTSRNSFGAPKDSALKESALPRPVLAGSGGPAVNSPEEGSRGQIIDDQETGDNSRAPALLRRRGTSRPTPG